MKRFFKLLIISLLLFTGVNSYPSTRDEKKALEDIEILFLKEDYKAVDSRCNRFLRDFKRSRLKKRVQYLHGMAYEKVNEKEVRKEEIKKDEYKKAEEIYYIVQIGAFEDYKNAVKLKRELNRKGFECIVIKIPAETGLLYKVRAGKFSNQDNAERLVADLKRRGYNPEIITE